MTAEESARFARVLREAFDVGERMFAHRGIAKAQAWALRKMLVSCSGVLAPAEEPCEKDEARADVAHALVALLALAGHLGLDDVLVNVEMVTRAQEDTLDRDLA